MAIHSSTMAMTMANNPSAMMQMPPANGQMPTQMVSIGDLLELAIKKTYRELSLLAELLPRKTDMERKIEIMLFANRNRQLFVRLMALVKWAGSASKVEKCSQIVSFLDKQSMLFTVTADILARLSRETLVTARLPAFQLLSAVEVMTMGTYSRLPSCIRDKLVPPDPISNSEKRSALFQLNHIIQQRLVASELPLQMRNIKIEFGRATFTVTNEFSLALTLLSDNANLPWKVLNIEILIEDKEINDIKDLVYQSQLVYIRNIVQTRLNENIKPLVEAYNILHTFCLGLQLQVLYYQSAYLQFERLKDFIHIDEYVSSKHLIISYWKDSDKSSYKLNIQIDSSEPCKPLQLQHIPDFDSKVFLKSIQANILSIEKILLFTTHERSKIKLNNLKKLIEEKHPSLFCELFELPAVLHVSFIDPCMPSEQLLISIDMLTGQYLVHIPQYEDCPIIADFEAFLNKDIDKIFTLIDKLKMWITKERCKKTVEALPVQIRESLQFPPNYTHDCFNIKGNKIYFQFNRHQDKCLMVVFDISKNNYNIWMDFYLMHLKYVSISKDNNQIPLPSLFEPDMPKPFMKILKVLPLDFSSIFQSSNLINEEETLPIDNVAIGAKRKLLEGNELPIVKKKKIPGYYISKLAHVVSLCEEKLSYSCLSTELYRRGINHQVVPDLNGYTHYIDIIRFPSSSWCSPDLAEKIQSNTLSCTIRLHGKSSKLWNVLISFATPPIQNLPVKENCLKNIVNNSYDNGTSSKTIIIKMVDDLVFDWTAIAHLYDVVETFSNDIKNNILNINTSTFEIKSFTYKKISIGYGPSKSFFVLIYYKFSEKRFQLSFGVSNQASSNTNPHINISNQLQYEFNHHLSIVQLIQVLNYTLNPLLALQNLKSIPILGTFGSRPNLPVLSFSILHESSNHIKLVYRNIYCLDIIMYPDNLVSIRDGALSNFDNSKVLGDFTPIQGLKAFLSKFVDKTLHTRRLSQSEDDNPPSPLAPVEYNDNYMYPGSQMMPNANISMNENISNRGAVLQHSSPHTPASPLASVLSVHSNYAPSPGNFSLSSPPSHPSLQQANQAIPMVPSPQMLGLEQSPASVFNINSPMNSNLATPSPSFLPTPSPGPNTNFHTQSPVPQFMPQSHESGIGSPFSQPNIPGSIPAQQSISSPLPNLWPSSPSVSRPSPRSVASTQSPGGTTLMSNQNVPQIASQPYNTTHGLQCRTLPAKSWAAALPTMLTHQGFEMMCRPNDGIATQNSNLYYSYSQLEKFLGSTFMRRIFNKPIDENFTVIPTPLEPGTILFKNDTLQFKIWTDFNTLQIHLDVKSISELNQWNRDELDILQQYFETKIACPPYKPSAFPTFCTFLTLPVRLLKDLIKIMKLELHPDPTLKWSLQITYTFPPFCTNQPASSIGMYTFLMLKNRILMFFQLSYKGVVQQGTIMNQPILILPLIYDIPTNVVSLSTTNCSNKNLAEHVNKVLKRFTYTQNVDCIFYAVIREILATLQLS